MFNYIKQKVCSAWDWANGKRKAIAGTALVSAASSTGAHAQADPLADLLAGIDSSTGVGLTIAAASVTLFLIGLAIRFARKGTK